MPPVPFDIEQESFLARDDDLPAAVKEKASPRRPPRRWGPLAVGVAGLGGVVAAALSDGWVVAETDISFKNLGESHAIELRLGLGRVRYERIRRTRLNVASTSLLDAHLREACAARAADAPVAMVGRACGAMREAARRARAAIGCGGFVAATLAGGAARRP